MKWLFFLLVVVNICVVTWYNLQSNSLVADDLIYAPPVNTKIFTLDEGPLIDPDAQENIDIDLIDSVATELEQISEESPVIAEKKLPEKLFCPIVYFEKDQEKALIVDRLQAQALEFKEYRSTGDRDKYWVYIDAPEKREQAIAIVDQLRQKGIDSFIINRGEMKNRISLGLYSTSITANTEKERIANLSNLVVKVFEHTRKVPLSVIELEKGVTEKNWRALLSGLDLNKMMIKLEKNSC